MNKFIKPRPYADPEAAACKLLEIAASIEPIQDGRLFIEKLNAPMLYEHRASPDEYKAGLDLAVARGWLQIHESGTFVRMMPAGADLFGGQT